MHGLVDHRVGAALDGHIFGQGFHPVQRQARAHRDEKGRHGGLIFVADIDAGSRAILRIGLHQFAAVQGQLEAGHRNVGDVEAGRGHAIRIGHCRQETEIDTVLSGARQAHGKTPFLAEHGGGLAIDFQLDQGGSGGNKRHRHFTVDQHLGVDDGVPDNGRITIWRLGGGLNRTRIVSAAQHIFPFHGHPPGHHYRVCAGYGAIRGGAGFRFVGNQVGRGGHGQVDMGLWNLQSEAGRSRFWYRQTGDVSAV